MVIFKPQIRKTVTVATVFGLIVVLFGAAYLMLGTSSAPVASAQGVEPPDPTEPYFFTRTLTFGGGISLTEIIINGPPTPPPGYELEHAAVALPQSNQPMAIRTLTVPAFNWVFGCSSVSGAMIAGYYDRNGFANMYAGPTNGGVMPLDNSSWGTWSDGFSTYPNLPLAASHNGVDGRATRGSIDDYWVQYNSSANDPYIPGGWTQHTWSDAIGDYMKTSQSAYGNTDGSTTFYNYTTSAIPLTCSDMVTYGIDTLDGTYGRKLFYEARGYTVTDCYSQNTDNTVAGGFSLAQFRAEIDAGRPVMLNLEGHTIVGVGYDDANSTIYIHDTWDYNNHTMTWGTSYMGMGLLSVSIVNLRTNTATSVTSAPNPSTYGQSVAFTATVTATLGTPAGTVQFYADGVTLGAPQTLSNGRATIVTSTLGVGTHTITATYPGNTSFYASTGTLAPNQVVNPSTVTWNGNTSTDWFIASNWSPGLVPTIGTNVIVPTAPTGNRWPILTGAATINDLTLQSGAVLTISQGVALRVNGLVANNGALAQINTVPASATTEFLHITDATGTVDKYHGVDLTPGSTAMGVTTVRIKGNQSACTNNAADPILQRCYQIDPTTQVSATVRFWFTAAELHAQVANQLALWHWGAWTQVGTTGNYSYSESGANSLSGGGQACWFQVTGVATYSPFVLGSGLAPTAVRLVDMNASDPTALPPVLWAVVLLSGLSLSGFLLRRARR